MTGFDVRGIAIFDGHLLFPASGLRTSDSSFEEGEVLNADGYTALDSTVTMVTVPRVI